MTLDTPRIAIVGAGFTGTLLAVQLLRQGQGRVGVDLIERSGRFGPGLAYTTGNPNHLLNVRAVNMSAFAEQPTHFLDWLRHTPLSPVESRDEAAPIFVERRVFGRYVGHCLAEAQAAAPPEALAILSDRVLAIEARGPAVTLHLAQGGTRRAEAAVLALGQLPPTPPACDPAQLMALAAYRADPWETGALSGLHPRAPVLLLGSGLTMVDLVIALLDRGHRGPITALSRRGLLPQRHAAATPRASFLPARPPGSLSALTRLVRAEVARARTAGEDWRGVIDALRPDTTALWQALPLVERARFLRHLRPWWEVARHRMAPAVADRIAGAAGSGQLSVVAGRLQTGCPEGDGARLTYRRRSDGSLGTLVAERIVNCSGPSTDLARSIDPLLRQLRASGQIRADALGLGIDVTADCAAIADDGSTAQRLYAAGPLCKGAFWEITAVPDLRRQCAALAQHLLRRLRQAEAA